MRSEDLISVVRTCLTHSKHGIALTRNIPPFLQRCPGARWFRGNSLYTSLCSTSFEKGGCARDGERDSEPLSRQRARHPKQDLELETGRGSSSTPLGCFPAPSQEPSPAKPALLLKPQAAWSGWGQRPPLVKSPRLARLFSDLPRAQQASVEAPVVRAWLVTLRGKLQTEEQTQHEEV